MPRACFGLQHFLNMFLSNLGFHLPYLYLYTIVVLVIEYQHFIQKLQTEMNPASQEVDVML